jgi:alpha-L-fucosidase 2
MTALIALAALAGPASGSDLDLLAPIDRWDEAVPLGNGLTGGLLWGEGRTVRLSVDRGDLWDERPQPETLQPDWNWQTMRRLKEAGDQAGMSRLFDAPYDRPNPTKLPGARLEVMLAAGSARRFRLDLETAEARLDAGQIQGRAFFSATEPVAFAEFTGPADPLVGFVWRPNEAVAQLGYPKARAHADTGEAWVVQEAPDQSYAFVCVGRRADGKATLAIVSERGGPGEGEALVTRGRDRAKRALARGYDAVRARHVEWWRKFWGVSAVRVPDKDIQRQYDLCRYFYGSSSRRGAPPIPLQGVWTADAGVLPPWKGDYHHDLNTQLTYWPYATAGHFDEGLAFLDHLWTQLPTYREFARAFYGVEGAVVPGVATLAGKPLAGWGMYSLSPTNTAWLAQGFDLHWRVTRDRKFLESRAYPWCSAVGEALDALLVAGADGVRRLPLSSSPEVHDNSLRAFLTPNSNYDQALLSWLFGALVDQAEALGRDEDAARWRRVLVAQPPLAFAADGSLLLAPDEALTGSHRHHSNLMAVHPLGLLGPDDPSDLARIRASVAHNLKQGTSAWVGYSWSWMACLLARARQGDEALIALRDFSTAFVSRNGFHLNGDQSGRGLTGFTYRPFTLEGNFAAMQAVHELLLQSFGGKVRLFPACPAEWRDVEFSRWRAEGGWVVSARRVGGRVVEVRVRATAAGRLRLELDSPTSLEWDRSISLDSRVVTVELQAGQELLGRVRGTRVGGDQQAEGAPGLPGPAHRKASPSRERAVGLNPLPSPRAGALPSSSQGEGRQNARVDEPPSSCAGGAEHEEGGRGVEKRSPQTR